MFEIILTDNGWEFSKPNDIEFDYTTGEKITKKLHLKYIPKDEVDLSYKLLIK